MPSAAKKRRPGITAAFEACARVALESRKPLWALAFRSGGPSDFQLEPNCRISQANRHIAGGDYLMISSSNRSLGRKPIDTHLVFRYGEERTAGKRRYGFGATGGRMAARTTGSKNGESQGSTSVTGILSRNTGQWFIRPTLGLYEPRNLIRPRLIRSATTTVIS